MRGRICGYTAKAGVKMAVAVVMGMTLASCGAIEIDNQARREGEPSESSSESEVGTPTKGNDGRMLQPEGHEGLWFETEPADPWERYVWLSQKYVGDPVVLGQLEEGDAAAPFVGEPDICSDSVVERMGELGFEEEPGMNEEQIYSCDFSVRVVPESVFPANVSVDMFRFSDDWNAPKTNIKLGPFSEELMRTTSDTGDDLSCVALASVPKSDMKTLVSNDMGYRSDGFHDACRRAYLSYWIFKNIGLLGEGK
ncbi:hypothetical protein [Corynebacterium dentalis]|uniref:hypothetical protein n=1 Tax=Corynebacterium dentalis TaxID=2014528 RepID=UPI0028A15C2D|nr:hypothetical protein [Corynebacterium dentalis]